MESKKINQLATELTPALDDLTIIGDPTTGISKKITLSQMASLFTGTVEEYANVAAFPLVGVADTIYIALDTNVLYRWDTSLTSYVELSPNIINSLVFSDANGFDGNISLVGSVATLTITTALTTGSVPFIGASGALSQDNANLFFDDTNNRLGINTNSPTTALDIFGSGIIGRINGTSTNNAFLGFASAGTNKWSVGNVQSDHRFRIYSEANTAELLSVLQTGEFGIGIANPTTKIHIDGGASALIANLDANVSVAKSLSFRSDNSNRINLEVSGTESGSNAGADFFIRRYSDAGSLIDTPFSLTRSTGYSRFANKLFVSAAGNAPSFTWSGINDLAVTNNLFASQALITNNSTLGNYSTHSIGKTRGTLASPTAVANGEIVGNVLFFGHDGTNYISGNEIVATVDGTVASGIVPLSMTFRTRNASGTMADRLVISANGNVGVGSAANERFGVTGTGGVLGFSRFTDGATAALFIGVNSGVPFLHSNNSVLAFGANGSNNFAETMRLSNGNVAIGTSDVSSYNDGFGNRLVLANTSGSTGLTLVTSIGGNGNIYFADGTSGDQQFRGIIAYEHANDAMRFSTQGTERLRITSAGNIRIVNGGDLEIYPTSGSSYAAIYNDSDNLNIWNNGSERMRITSAGKLCVGRTATIFANARHTIDGNAGSGGEPVLEVYNSNLADSAPAIACIKNSATTNSSARFMQFYSDGGNIAMGGIVGNGSSTVQFFSISDIREKENIISINGSLNKILALNPVEFDWKKTGEHINAGFIAQEVEEIFPEFVVDNASNEGEEDRKGLTGGLTSGIVAHLVKAMQEQQSQIEELKALINK
jgi:hypothetical protein